MRHLILLLLSLICIVPASLGQGSYRAAGIPDSLKQDAGAVIRYYSTRYDRKSPEKYTVDVHIAVTVLNQQGKDNSELMIYYDRNSKVSKVKGSIYNASGMLITELKKSDLKDYAINPDFTLFSDSRVIHYRPVVSGFPYTAEYIYTLEFTGTAGFNAWIPQKAFRVSAEQAELLFTTSAEADIRFRELNHPFACEAVKNGKVNTYKWKVTNLRAVKDEPRAPDFFDIMPAVLLAPDNIVYEGTAGNFSTWSDYGKWVGGLIENRDALPEKTINHIRELTAGLPDAKARAQAVYRYMQQRTRYVNIALGIGGFQPVQASVVDEKGYGDCKALSNYTKALLKAAGIESFYAETGTGRYHNIRFHDFSSTNQTNHVMLCVPLEKDTVWLECTNQNIPFGYIGPSSQGRYALLVKPEGGVLARTTSFESSPGSRGSTVHCTIGETGETSFTLEASYRNNLYEGLSGLMNLSPKEQKEVLLQSFSGIRQVSVAGYSVQDKSDSCFTAGLSVQGTVGSYPVKAGSRLIFEPLFFFSAGLSGPLSENRKLPVVEPYSYNCADTFRIDLPHGYKVEYLPETRSISSCYASYSYEAHQQENAITVVRKVTVNKGNYNPGQFAEINDFVKAVSGGESRKIICVKNEG